MHVRVQKEKESISRCSPPPESSHSQLEEQLSRPPQLAMLRVANFARSAVTRGAALRSRCAVIRAPVSPFSTLPADGTTVTKFSSDHEWVTLDSSGVATVGITNQAQDMLGDIVFVQLPEADEAFEAGEALGSVDSVKTSSDVYCPLPGTVIETNEQLADNPALVNEDAQGEAWFVKIQVEDDVSALDDLMDEAAYLKMCEEESHCGSFLKVLMVFGLLRGLRERMLEVAPCIMSRVPLVLPLFRHVTSTRNS